MFAAVQPENAWYIPLAVVAPFIPLGLLCLAEIWYYSKWW